MIIILNFNIISSPSTVLAMVSFSLEKKITLSQGPEANASFHCKETHAVSCDSKEFTPSAEDPFAGSTFFSSFQIISDHT
jgi:hypothetical protein